MMRKEILHVDQHTLPYLKTLKKARGKRVFEGINVKMLGGGVPGGFPPGIEYEKAFFK